MIETTHAEKTNLIKIDETIYEELASQFKVFPISFPEFPTPILDLFSALEMPDYDRKMLAFATTQILSFLRSPILTDNITELLPEAEKPKNHDYRRAWRLRQLPELMQNQNLDYNFNKLKGNYLGSMAGYLKYLAMFLPGTRFATIRKTSNQIAYDIEAIAAPKPQAKSLYNTMSVTDKIAFVTGIDQRIRQLLEILANQITTQE